MSQLPPRARTLFTDSDSKLEMGKIITAEASRTAPKEHRFAPAQKGLWHILEHGTTSFSHRFYTKGSKLLFQGNEGSYLKLFSHPSALVWAVSPYS